jgi:hypothetical protein
MYIRLCTYIHTYLTYIAYAYRIPHYLAVYKILFHWRESSLLVPIRADEAESKCHGSIRMRQDTDI